MQYNSVMRLLRLNFPARPPRLLSSCTSTSSSLPVPPFTVLMTTGWGLIWHIFATIQPTHLAWPSLSACFLTPRRPDINPPSPLPTMHSRPNRPSATQASCGRIQKQEKKEIFPVYPEKPPKKRAPLGARYRVCVRVCVCMRNSEENRVIYRTAARYKLQNRLRSLWFSKLKKLPSGWLVPLFSKNIFSRSFRWRYFQEFPPSVP